MPMSPPRVRDKMLWLIVTQAAAIATGARACDQGLQARAEADRVAAARHRLDMAADYLHSQGDMLNGGVSCGPDGCAKVSPFDPSVTPERRAARIAYHTAMSEKSERAARYPCLPVDPTRLRTYPSRPAAR